MPIIVEHNIPKGTLAQVLASAEAGLQTRRDDERAFRNQQEATRTGIAQQQVDINRDNELYRREHGQDAIRYQYDRADQHDQLRFDLDMRRAEMGQGGKLDAQLDPTTRQKLAKIQSARVYLATSEEYPPEQKQAYTDQLDQQERALRMEGILGSGPSPIEEAQSRMWKGPDGMMYSVDKTGEIRQHPGPKPGTAGTDPEKQTDAIRKRFEAHKKNLTVTNDATGELKVPTNAEIVKAMRDEDDGVAQYLDPSKKPAADPAAPPPPSPEEQAALARQAAAMLQERLRVESIIPPTHPINKLPDTTAFPSTDPSVGTVTVAELKQVALLSGAPIDVVIAKYVRPRGSGPGSSASPSARPTPAQVRAQFENSMRPPERDQEAMINEATQRGKQRAAVQPGLSTGFAERILQQAPPPKRASYVLKD